jgi:threonine dehydrogenase-like Zn-dependent dehydrogenase
MRAAIFNGPGSIEIGHRPDPRVEQPTDAVVRVVMACVCGSDLGYYRGESQHAIGSIGPEFIGVVEDVGAEVSSVAAGALVKVPGSGHADATLKSLLDFETDLDGAPEAYEAMDERTAIKSLLRVGSL